MASSTESEKNKNNENFMKLITTTADRTVITARQENDELIVCVTDGRNVWRKTVNQQSKDYFTKFRAALVNVEIKLSPDGAPHLTLNVAGTVVQLILEQISADDDKQSELQRILFHAVERSDELETRLKTSESRVETLEKKAASATKNVFDIGYDSKKRKKNAPKVAPKLAGMSVVNPGSKKRKAPKGVEFD